MLLSTIFNYFTFHGFQFVNKVSKLWKKKRKKKSFNTIPKYSIKIWDWQVGWFYGMSNFVGLNSDFNITYTSCCDKVEESKLTYYLPIDERERRNRFMPFQRALAQSDTQPSLKCIYCMYFFDFLSPPVPISHHT